MHESEAQGNTSGLLVTLLALATRTVVKQVASDSGFLQIRRQRQRNVLF